ncbi:MAG: hypothetical protein VYE22_17955 [Myxococcota bacterium]|nr:hypothetical protein [Myxococcota bacterium]
MRTTVTLAALAGLLTACSLECTLVDCTSTLEVRLSHDLDLASGPYQVEITTPQQELRCSVGPEPADDMASCFGYRFATLRWDEATVVVTLTEPFGDAELNPDGAPFESVDVTVSQGGTELWRETVAVDAGEPNMPNGPGCAPTCWSAVASESL